MSALTHWFIDWLQSSQQTLLGLGWIGVAAWAGVIFLAQLFLAPLSPVAVAGGFIFGLQRGFVAITVGTAAGAAVNFLIARHLARAPISRRLERNARFRFIDAAIGRDGWKIVALLRFCPIPFGFANYAYGLTAIPFWPYFLASVLAIVPANTFFVWLGATAHAGLEVALGAGRPRHPFEYAMLGFGLVAGLVAMTYLARIARTAMARVPVAE